MFSDEEVDAAVQRYLLQGLTATKTGLGNRDTLATKQQVYDLIATGIMLRPRTFYYLVWLATNRLKARVTQQSNALSLIIAAATTSSGTSKRVESVTELYNAEAALAGMAAAFNTRKGSGTSGVVGPANQRFDTAVERFARTELTKNVVSSGAVVETPEQQRAVIEATWPIATEQYTDISARVAVLRTADASYVATKLPDTTLSSILTKILAKIKELQVSMGAQTAPRDSRLALLDLLTMRALLRRAAAFQGPRTVLAPLQQDPDVGTVQGPTGTGGALLSTVSAPWNYAAGATLSLVLDSGAESPVISLPGTSAAVLRSKTMNPWVLPPSTNNATIATNGGAPVSVAMAAWASGTIAAAALAAAFPLLSIAWDSGTFQIVFTTLVTGDQARIDVQGSDDFKSWAFQAAVAPVIGTPVTSEDVIAAVGASSGLLKATIARTDYGRFTVAASGTTLTRHAAAGADLAADGSTTVHVGADVAALGVEPGMWISITSPAVYAEIVSIDAGDLVLSLPVATVTGASYFIGNDLTMIPAGARVLAKSATGVNQHTSRVVSSAAGTLTVDVAYTADTALEIFVFTEFLQLVTAGTITSSGVAALAGTGATAFGLSTTAVLSSLQHFVVDVDFLARGVEVGDLLRLVSPTALAYEVTVVEASPGELLFAPAVPQEAGSWTYEVVAAAADSYDALQVALRAYQSSVPTLTALDATVRRLVAGGRYLTAQQALLEGYVATLATLATALDAYVVTKEPAIEQAVRVLKDTGFDRALDLLIDLDLEEFFAMKDDEVSYKTWLIRKSADVTKVVTPVSQGFNQEGHWRTTSARSTTFDPNGRK